MRGRNKNRTGGEKESKERNGKKTAMQERRHWGQKKKMTGGKENT